MEYIKLNTGIDIPILGSGTNTYGKVDNKYKGEINGDTTELESAIESGYRHFDTAVSYRNEAVVGKAVKESGLDRKEFFLTSKLPTKPEYKEYRESEEAVRRTVEASLEALGGEYIDLYLLHNAWEPLENIAEVWKVLEDYVDQGKLKAIGVSNFNEEQLGYLMEHSRIKPALNQVVSHPGKWNHAIIEYCKAHGVVPEAWGPLSGVSEENKTTLTQIGDKYDKTWAQVLLRYQIQRGVVVIPKSHNPKRQKANLNVFDFELTEEEIQVIEKM